MHLPRPIADIIQLLTPEPIQYFSNPSLTVCVFVSLSLSLSRCLCVMICTYVHTLMHEFKIPEAPLSRSQMLQLEDTPLLTKRNMKHCSLERNSGTCPRHYVRFNPEEISKPVFCLSLFLNVYNPESFNVHL